MRVWLNGLQWDKPPNLSRPQAQGETPGVLSGEHEKSFFFRAQGSRSCVEDKPVLREAWRPYMDKHLGVISGMFQDLKHMLRGDTMIARLALSRQYRHRPGQGVLCDFLRQTHVKIFLRKWYNWVKNCPSSLSSEPAHCLTERKV